MNRRNFVQQTGLLISGHSFLSDLSISALHGGNGSLEYASPESQGVLSEAITAYLKAADTSGLEHHGFVMSRYGKVIAEAYWKPFSADHIHTLYSLSKSFTSTAVGMAIQEGYLKLTDKIYSFFPDMLPESMSENLMKMEIRHVLNMATGHIKDTMGIMRNATDVPWSKTFLAQPVDKEPGTHFLYNTGATYILSAIVSRLVGMTLQEYLKTRLYDPLGIKGTDWELSPEGFNVAGYGLRVSTRDIIRFGNLYLNNGKINNKELIPADYVKEATTSHIPSSPTGGDWGEGYGYQFWRCRHNFYRGDGAHGQYCIVMPQYGIVIAINSESANMQKQMNLVWDYILPGIKEKSLNSNKSAADELKAVAEKLMLNANMGTVTPLQPKKMILDQNEYNINSIELTADNMIIKKSTDTIEIPFGWNKWKLNKVRIGNPFNKNYQSMVPSKIAATAGVDRNDFKLRIKYIEAIHGDLITLKTNADNTVEVTLLSSLVEKNINNQKESRKPLTGKII
jgi:CubicO group peptidase (beta-lactamase class C family)